MGSELFIALRFISLLHLIKCFANECTSRLELPPNSEHPNPSKLEGLIQTKLRGIAGLL